MDRGLVQERAAWKEERWYHGGNGRDKYGQWRWMHMTATKLPCYSVMFRAMDWYSRRGGRDGFRS